MLINHNLCYNLTTETNLTIGTLFLNIGGANMKNIIIISNRLPVTVKKVGDDFEYIESIGGLTTGLKNCHNQEGSLWIGWPGLSDDELNDEDRKIITKTLIEKYKCIPVFLTDEEIERYYYGFCNKTIWPLFHYFISKTIYDFDNWESYKQVNEKFLLAAEVHLKEDSVVWVHDYQLMLLPNMIRGVRPRIPIGFFLHIPFPSFEIFRLLIWRTEILQGVLGADLIGFHTYSYVQHFLASTRNLLNTEDNFNEIDYGDRQIKVDAFPMGIDYQQFAAEYDISDCDVDAINIDKLNGTKVIFSVDRLDYTKGIPQKIKAIKCFFTKYPEYIEKVRWYLILAPSREEIDTYDSLLSEIKEDISEINGEFGTVNWMPIWFFYRSYSQESLIHFYRNTDVLLITPLRDGMNLVAKEYIASRTDYDGMLVISETAGVASQLLEAVSVNPNDYNAIAYGIKTALEMPKEEKMARNKTMHNRIKRYDVHFWASEFLKALKGVTGDVKVADSMLNLDYNSKDIQDAYANSKNRVLFLDYDGTMVGFKATPKEAYPDDELKSLLTRLTSDPKNTLVIISGRDTNTLDKWLGDINGLNFISSHGLWIKFSGEKDWTMTTELNNEWKDQIRPILELYLDILPGTLIEEKDYSLAWHYRRCNPDNIKLKLSELKETLTAMITSTTLALQEGNKVLEVKDGRVNKGETASIILKSNDYDFILGAGDDYTDEDLFSVLPKEAYSIKIGKDKTIAGYRTKDWKSMRRILEKLADID